MPLFQIILCAEKRLADAGIDNPALDARLLIGAALGMDRAQLLSANQRELSQKESDAIEELVARREAREPVARILGLREFWGLPFGLNEATLEPRPDTETLVEIALSHFPSDMPPRLLDLGTGTGCLLLALLHERPNATGIGIDIAPRAVEQAIKNAEHLGLMDRAAFRIDNWLDNTDETFDLVVSNPPYIPGTDFAALQPEVREHDPLAALNGGTDGLDPYRHLIPRLPRFLNEGGMVLFEVGIHQATDVADLMRTNGFTNVSIHKDLGGIDRCVAGWKRH